MQATKSKTSAIEQSVELNVPVGTAYNQWTQFRDFPLFMPALTHVEQADDRRLEWSAEVAGKTYAGTMEICEQVPDKRIAWKSLSGPWNAGVVTFHRISDDRSKVMLQMDYSPDGLLEKARDALGVARGRVRAQLEGFRKFLETRGQETGAWRGEIPNKEER